MREAEDQEAESSVERGKGGEDGRDVRRKDVGKRIVGNEGERTVGGRVEEDNAGAVLQSVGRNFAEVMFVHSSEPLSTRSRAILEIPRERQGVKEGKRDKKRTVHPLRRVV